MLKHLESPRSPWYLLLLCCFISATATLGIFLFKAKTGTSSFSTEEAAVEMKSLVSNYKHQESKYIGKNLEYPESLVKIQGNLEGPPPPPYLLLIFSELGCNVCADDETQYGKKMSEQFPGKVHAIVYGTNRRYAMNYVRMNQTKFTVCYDDEATFHNINNISTSPMMLYVDECGVVSQAHIPITGHLDLCRPSHHLFSSLLSSYE